MLEGTIIKRTSYKWIQTNLKLIVIITGESKSYHCKAVYEGLVTIQRVYEWIQRVEVYGFNNYVTS